MIATVLATLTPRQRAVARLICLGRSPGEIAVELGISVRTFDTHRHSILERIGVRNNVELTRRIYGLVDEQGST